MSITFALDLPASAYESAPHSVTCGCPGVEPMLFPNAETTRQFIKHWRTTPENQRVPMTGCTDPDLCLHYGLQATPLGVGAHLNVNITNTNARHILAMLGLPPDTTPNTTRMPFSEDTTTGHTSADNFKGRVLMALAISPTDEDTPTTTAQHIDMGHHHGYTENVLTRLLALADEAIARNVNVGWC